MWSRCREKGCVVLSTRLVVLLASGVSGCVLASAPGAAAAPLGDVAGGGTPEHVVFSGQLERNGAPVQGQYLAELWPAQRHLASLRQGRPVPKYFIKKAQIPSSGEFRIDLNVDAIPAEFLGDSGQVDLTVRITDGREQAEWSQSFLRSDRDALSSRGNLKARWVPTGDRTRSKPDVVSFDLGRRTAVAASSPRRDVARGQQQVRTLDTTPVDLTHWAQAGGYTCRDFKGPARQNILEGFAYVYGWSGARASLDFDSGSSHSLGIGLTYGSGWSQSGTAGISTSSGATVTRVVDALAKNRVNYRDYYNECYPSRIQSRPESFYAILPTGDFTYARHVNFAYCATYYSGATPWKQSGTNTTVSGGVALGPVSLSAQSGWNSGTKVKWDITAKTKVCGSTSAGWASAPQADARAG